MYQAFYPGQVWLDTNGNPIQAHGGSIFHENGTYYWYGENKEKTLEELNKYINDMKIVMVNNADAGITTFSEFEDYFQVGLTMIHPDFQNKGIATKIISGYIEIARLKKKRIIIKTFKGNPAQRLYQRLGFKIYKTTESHLLLDITF